MDRRELNRMFDQLTPDPQREQELLNGLLRDNERSKKPTKNWKRMAVGMAAVMLLAGTAAAAHTLGVNIVEKDDGAVYFTGGMTYYAADHLSDKVKEFEAAYTGDMWPMKAFASWEEMENFIGVDIMNNPLLDASPATGFHQEWNLEKRVVGCHILEVYRGLTLLITHSCYEIGNANIIVDAYLFTDQGEERWDDDMFFGLGEYQDGTEISWEPCTTPAGRQVQVMEIDHPSSSHSSDKCIGALSLNGIPVLVRVYSGGGVAEAREVLMQVLDSFQ